MQRKILINARHPEEKRVAIVEDGRLVDFYVEVAARASVRGNIYKAVVVRVEPNLNACFVNYGPDKHGFLQMKDIAPSSYAKEAKGRHPAIQDVISKGQEIIVQVERDERDTKGASLTSYVSIPGRYLVMMPGQDRVGVSRKIEERGERGRLKDILKSMKLPKDTGFIIRTAGTDVDEDDLGNDLKYLTKLWTRIARDAKKAKAPALIYEEHDIAVRTVRDYLSKDVSGVIVDEKGTFRLVRDFLKRTMPWEEIALTEFTEPEPLFAVHGVEDQIMKLKEREVYLPSRGYIVIDRTEALTAIDVNSGRSRKDKNMDDMILRVNLDAAEEVARQLRLRDIGGLIVVDFIDMDSPRHRREVEERLSAALDRDKAHWDITRISKFGLVEMTRERMRTSYSDTSSKPCHTCGGLGVVPTPEMTGLGAFREIHRIASMNRPTSLKCLLGADAANYLLNSMRDQIAELEKELSFRIEVLVDTSLPPGKFDIEVTGGTEPAPVKKQQHEEQRPSRSQQSRGQKKGKEQGKGQAQEQAQEEAQEEGQGKKKRRRRRKKKSGLEGQTNGEAGMASVDSDEDGGADEREAFNAPLEESGTAEHEDVREGGPDETAGLTPAQKRRRRRRRKKKPGGEAQTPGADQHAAPEASDAGDEHAESGEAKHEGEPGLEKRKRRRRRRKKPSGEPGTVREASAGAMTAPSAPAPRAAEPVVEKAPVKPAVEAPEPAAKKTVARKKTVRKKAAPAETATPKAPVAAAEKKTVAKKTVAKKTTAKKTTAKKAVAKKATAKKTVAKKTTAKKATAKKKTVAEE